MAKQTKPSSSPPHREQARHRALADPSRSRILELLHQTEEPLDAHTLAARLDLHPSTIRGHLKTLADADLISAEREPRSQPGRPRRLYRPSADAPLNNDANSTLLLAKILASAIADTPNPAQLAEQAGCAWGHHLTTPPPPQTTTPGADAAARLTALHHDLGFDPTLKPHATGYTLCLNRCPYQPAATTYQDIICATHQGLLHGALTALNTNLTLKNLTPHAQPDHCTAHLTTTS